MPVDTNEVATNPRCKYVVNVEQCDVICKYVTCNVYSAAKS